MTELIRFISNIQQLDFETEKAIKRYFIEKTFKKDEYLVEAGKTCFSVFFIKSGFIRKFIINNGEEVTNWFYSKNQMVTSMLSFFEQKPAFEYFQAYEDTEVLSLSLNNEQELLEKFPLYAKFHLKQVRYYLSRLDEINNRIKLMTAK
jgi:CRP-like cAMP-binding protein